MKANNGVVNKNAKCISVECVIKSWIGTILLALHGQCPIHLQEILNQSGGILSSMAIVLSALSWLNLRF